MSTGLSGARARGKHAGLTREAVLRRAIGLVDEVGLDAFSMRRLGSELGVEAMALYHHVGNKQELLDGLVEQVFLDAVPTAVEDAPWQESMRQFARDAYDALVTHPHLVPLVLSRPATTTGVLHRLDQTVAALKAGGLSAPTALDLIYTIIGFVVGYVATGGNADEGNRTRLDRLAALDLSEHPALTEATRDRCDAGLQSTFDTTLTAILSGFETRTEHARLR